MATKTTTLLIDDINGGEATETVTFGLDGKTYEIDLNEDNANDLRDSLREFIGVANEVKSPTATARRARTAGGASLKEGEGPLIRAWAESKGIEVPPRGRIKKEIIDQYRAEAG